MKHASTFLGVLAALDAANTWRKHRARIRRRLARLVGPSTVTSRRGCGSELR